MATLINKMRSQKSVCFSFLQAEEQESKPQTNQDKESSEGGSRYQPVSSRTRSIQHETTADCVWQEYIRTVTRCCVTCEEPSLGIVVLFAGDSLRCKNSLDALCGMDKGNTVTRSSPMRRRKSDNKPNENKNSSCRTGPKSMKRNQVSEMRATRVASPRQRVGSNHSSIHHMVLPESVMETAKLLGVKSPPTTPKALAAIAKSSNAANGQKHTAPPQCLQNASVVAWRKTVGVLILLFIIAHSIQSIVYLSERAVDAFDLTLVSHTEALTVVWCSGWLTAATTGLGALPFLFVSDLSDWWLAVSNAFAAGMMLAAAAGLLAEGSTTDPLAATDEGLSPVSRLCIGFITGVLFIYASKLLLDEYEDVKVLDLDSLTTKKVLLIVSVMTLHSFSEGVGIGVSYNSQSLGTFITATLAIHNIPEGLAVAIVLVPRGVSVLYTTIWCVATSLPQPFMAVPAFMFVEEFSFILPIGLGFAAGAMGFVAVFELFMEAQEVLGTKSAGAIGAVALVLMAGAQMSLHS